jgi:site-specific DNA recombinase
MTRAAIYARVSKDEQASNFSLPTQLDECRKYAALKGYTVIIEVLEDESGTLLDRPGLDTLREMARNKSVDVLVVLELDRFARGMVKQLILEQEFNKHGVTIEYALAEYEDSPEGRLSKNIRATIAEYEREKFIERSNRGKQGRAKAGYVFPAGELNPYGYRYERSDKHKGAYVIIEHEAETVRLIFRWYVYGDEKGKKLGYIAIARRLSGMGMPTRYDQSTSRRKRSNYGAWSNITRIMVPGAISRSAKLSAMKPMPAWLTMAKPTW